MNEKYILLKVQNYLINKCQITKSAFDYIFADLPKNYLENITEILFKNGILIIKDTPDSSSTSNLIASEKRKLSKLTNEQLCILYKNGNKEIIDILCIKNKGFVCSVAKKFKNAYRNSLELDDLVNYGYLGFIEAVKRFDTSSEYKLISYAVHYIKQSILLNISDNGFTIRLPMYILAEIREILKLQTLNLCSSDFDIIEYFKSKNYNKNKITSLVNLFNNALHPASIFEKVDYEETVDLLDLLKSEIPTVEYTICRKELIKFVRASISSLPSCAKKIIELKYGLNGKAELTLEEIGVIMKLTRERVRQIADKFEKKLHKHLKPHLIEHQCWE